MSSAVGLYNLDLLIGLVSNLEYAILVAVKRNRCHACGAGHKCNLNILVCKAARKIAEFKAEEVSITAQCSGSNSTFDEFQFACNLTAVDCYVTLNIAGSFAASKVICCIIGRNGEVS